MAISLNANFEAENEKATNKPVVLVKLPDTETDTEKDSVWGTNESESQVDYTRGSVILDAQNSPAAALNVYTTAGADYHTIGDIDYTDPVTYSLNTYNIVWQKFRHYSASATYKLAALRLKLWYNTSAGAGNTQMTTRIYTSPRIFASGSGWGDYILSASYFLTLGVDAESTDLDIDFTYGAHTALNSGQDYWLMIWTQTFGGLVGNTVTKVKTSGESWFQGEGRIENSRIDDEIVRSWQLDQKQIMFRLTTTAVAPTEHYYTTGSIKIELDTGSTPAVNGEWVFVHQIPEFTTIIYTAWYSDNGVDFTAMGAVIDGQEITDLHRYYQVLASMTAAATMGYTTGAPTSTPTVESIGVRFTTYIKVSNHQNFGYEPSLKSVNSQNTTIARDSKSSISQLNLTFGLTDLISTWLNNKFPKNKLIKVLIGYDGMVEADFIDYNWGIVDNWAISATNDVSITCVDFRKDWKNPVPDSWNTSADDVIFGNNHPAQAIRMILQIHIGIRDSKIDVDSFDDVETALAGYTCNRIITGENFPGDDLIDELRQTMWAYFIPQANGSIKIKDYDSTDSALVDFTDDNLKAISYDGNSKSLANRIAAYYGYDSKTSDDDLSDYESVSIDIDATSVSNWGETKTIEILDKWTGISKTSQITDLTDKVLSRFKDVPALIKGTADLRYLWLEVGDMVTITTVKAPSDDLGGISAVKYEIISKNFDFLKTTIKFQFLEV